MTAVKNQDLLGTCTSFAVGACVEYRHSKNVVCEGIFTVEVERTRGDCKAGLSIGDGLTFAQTQGYVEEPFFPYAKYQETVAGAAGTTVAKVKADHSGGPERTKLANGTVCVNFPPVTTQPRFKLNSLEVIYHRAPSATPLAQAYVEVLKGFLVNRNSPIAVSVPVFSNIGWEKWSDDGIITMPRLAFSAWKDYETKTLDDTNTDNTSPKKTGWHAIVIVGYDESKKLFKFKNSWSGLWGDGKGYGYLPYDYILTYSDIAVATF
jgi:hypothetical protein